MPIPDEIHGRKYFLLTSFRKNGAAIATPLWFGASNDKLYAMTRRDSGKCKRIRNNPQVRIAPCTIRGKVTGPEFAGRARILPPEDWPWARKIIQKKYWLTRISALWNKKQNAYMEIEITSSLGDR